MNTIVITDQEYEIIRESYLYERTQGVKFVFSKLVQDGIPESRAREIIENADSLKLLNGKMVVVRKKQDDESAIFKYLDIRAISLGLLTIILVMVVHNIHKIIFLILK
jgi:hypothetical protein